MQITRKDFLKASVGATVTLLVVSACGSSSSNGSTASCSDGITTDIGSNHLAPHQHIMKVTLTDVNHGTDKTYDIQGNATHNHTVLISEAQYQQLLQGQTIESTSSQTEEHTHLITVVCG